MTKLQLLEGVFIVDRVEQLENSIQVLQEFEFTKYNRDHVSKMIDTARAEIAKLKKKFKEL